jgi:hypothetical protein
MELVSTKRGQRRATIGVFLAGCVLAVAGVANPTSAADPTQAAPIPAGFSITDLAQRDDARQKVNHSPTGRIEAEISSEFERTRSALRAT